METFSVIPIYYMVCFIIKCNKNKNYTNPLTIMQEESIEGQQP